MTQDLRHKIVAAARECVGTKFHHQGRKIGVGIDCIGVIVHVATRCGNLTGGYDRTNYGRHPTDDTLHRELLRAGLREISAEDAGIGDVLGLRLHSRLGHAAVITPVGMVHAWFGCKSTVEHEIMPRWRKRIVRYYRFRGVDG